MSPINDRLGDCSTSIFFLFRNNEETRFFIKELVKNRVDAWSPITKGHVYKDWIPILNKVGAHHPKRNGFNFIKSLPNYSSDMCPKTLSILNKTAAIRTKIDRSKDEHNKLIDTLIKVLKNLK